MNARFHFLSILLLVLFSAQISLANTNSAAVLARKAASEDPAEASAAIEELRALGPNGLEALMREYASDINVRVADPKIGDTPEWQRIANALDLVGQQKNNFISGLYWYTDFEQAKKAARETGKPILSLRLLGNLTDELSCANSRFFRTVLYPNAQIRDILRDRFVLHWKSVRPVPRITVDFGDGRKLERTVTGNSIHYILDSDGRLIEALPGLYGPVAFQRWLEGAETLMRSVAGKNDQERNFLLVKFYGERIDRISRSWLTDTKPLAGKLNRDLRVPPGQSATVVAGLAATKMGTERPIVRAVTSVKDDGGIADEAAWKLIASLHQADATLDERSRSLMLRQNRSLPVYQLGRMILRFQESIAVDTVRNEYVMHPTLYGMMSSEADRADLDKFNALVYSLVFRTPNNDPWLGLLSSDIYTAIEDK